MKIHNCYFDLFFGEEKGTRVLTYTHVGRARMNHQYLHGLYQPLMQQSSGLFTIALLTIFYVVGWIYIPSGNPAQDIHGKSLCLIGKSGKSSTNGLYVP